MGPFVEVLRLQDSIPAPHHYTGSQPHASTDNIELICNLEGQFTSRCEHESIDAVRIFREGLQNGNGEGEGFAGTSFGDADAVTAVENGRDARDLYGRRFDYPNLWT